MPPIVNFLTTNPAVPPQALSSVKVTLCGAAPSGSALIEQYLSKFNHGMAYVEGIIHTFLYILRIYRNLTELFTSSLSIRKVFD